MLTVLGRETSINVRKVLWCVAELGIPIIREDWGLPLRDPREARLLALNPNAQVPVIVEDDGFTLWESNVILRYLCQRQSDTTLLPSDLRARTRVEQWLQWQATELNPSWGYAVRALLRGDPGHDDEEQIAQSLGAWTAKMEILEGRLATTRAYAGGATFSIADIAIGLSVRRWRAIPRSLPDLPHVARYFARLEKRPAAVRYLGADFF